MFYFKSEKELFLVYFVNISGWCPADTPEDTASSALVGAPD